MATRTPTYRVADLSRGDVIESPDGPKTITAVRKVSKRRVKLYTSDGMTRVAQAEEKVKLVPVS